MKRFVKKTLAFVVLLSVMTTGFVPFTAFADSTVAVNTDYSKISVKIPSKFTVLTTEDVDKGAAFYKDLPLSKNEAIKRIDSGVLIDAFSNDKQREIRFSVFSANKIGKYSSESSRAAESVAKTEESEHSLISGINNFSDLEKSERESVISTVADALKAQGHTLLSTPSEIKLSDYYFIKIYARIGDTTTGYTYTSVMTIVGGRCYELTCFDSSPVLEQSQIDANESVISTLNLAINGNSGEIASNNFQSIVVFIVILLSIALIFGVVVSFIKPIVESRNADEPIRPKKRK